MIKLDPNLVRLYKYFGPYKLRLALAGVFLLGAASMTSLTATLLGQLTDNGFYSADLKTILFAPAALIGVALLYAVSTVMSAVIMADVSQSVLLTIRNAMYEKVLHWPSASYQENATGRITSKFVNEATMAMGGATQSVTVLIRDSVQVVALLGVLFWHNWQLTLVTFIVMPGVAIILRMISKRMRRIVKESQDNLGHMISIVQESYSAERLVKVSDTYDFEETRFAKTNEKLRRLALKAIQAQSFSTPAVQMFTMVAIAFVVGVALFEAQKGLLTIGEFITFLSAMLLMRAPIQRLSGLNATFASLSVAAKSVFDTMDAPLEVDQGATDIERVKGDIVFTDVRLRYPGQTEDAIKGFDLTIRAGEHVALVGQSGSGKTSIVNLLPRFWELTSGTITIDGVNIQDFTLASLRRQIAIVTQDVVMFDDTIRNNITYGMGEVSDEALERAIDAAALTDFIASLPKGLDTSVGESGSLLSGGQKQRISIARAFLKDAPILIMDEATSALDSVTENQIKEALVTLSRGRTCLTVAHRFSTIENANHIVVMKEGVVVEEGTREALLAKEGMFAELYRLQVHE